MLNQTIQMSKTSNYKNLAPIAPAPLIAPKPASQGVTIKPLPKPITPAIKHHNNDDIQSLPCIITSKQWILPPRPKAGRKPSSAEKKSKAMSQSTSMQSLTSLSNNMTSLNLKTKSENMKLQLDEDLKSQLENATEENQKLKNIISRLKNEIESLKTSSPNLMPNDYSPPPQIAYMNDISHRSNRNGSVTSTVSTPNPATTSGNLREISPTVDPKFIGITAPGTMQKRTKRPYNKKKKKDATAAVTSNTITSSITTMNRPTKVKIEDSPSPISLTADTIVKQERSSPDLPNVDSILTNNNSTHTITRDEVDLQPSKRSKTLKLERSMSLQTYDLMLSPPSSFHLDRTTSTPLDSFEFQMHATGLSRTTTLTTIDNEFNWDLGNTGDSCSLCNSDGGDCLCLDKKRINTNTMTKKNDEDEENFKNDMKMINEHDELIDMNLFLETENNEFNLLM